MKLLEASAVIGMSVAITALFAHQITERKLAEQDKMSWGTRDYAVSKAIKEILADCREQSRKFSTPTNSRMLGVCAELESSAAKRIAFGDNNEN